MPGLGRGAAEAVARVEQQSLGEGAVARAFSVWKRSVHGPARHLRFRPDDCGHLECCRTHLAARDVLASAMRRLPTKAARDLRDLVGPYDEIFESRSLVDPGAPDTDAWWHRRFVP